MKSQATPLAILLLAGLMLFGCGGREARPVAKTTSFDERLSCGHLDSQFGANEARMADLGVEAKLQSDQNVGMVLVAPLFLNLNDSEQQEIDALRERNLVLIDLAEKKDCAWLAERQAAADAEALEAAAQDSEEGAEAAE